MAPALSRDRLLPGQRRSVVLLRDNARGDVLLPGQRRSDVLLVMQGLIRIDCGCPPGRNVAGE